jgi:hypothetical protein
MGKTAKRRRRLSDGYSFAGFRTKETVRGVFGDPDVRIVSLDRRSKKPSAAVVEACSQAGTTDACGGFATCRALDFGLSWNSRCGVSHAAIAAA